MRSIFRKPLRAIAKLLLDEINKIAVTDAQKQVHATGNVRFLPEAKVFNLQHNPEKIIIGNGSAIRGELLIFKHGGSIEIGTNCYIGEHSRIWSASKIWIGSNVLISHNVNIMDSNGHEIDHMKRAESYERLLISGHPLVQNDVITKPIEIDDFAWINFNCSILKGVKIGKGAIVAPGSVVTSDVNPFTLVGGSPAKEIRVLGNSDFEDA